MPVAPSDASPRLADRVLLIGWDAADWGIIDPLIANGRMPHLAKLIAAGVRGTMAAQRPLLSPMLWTSIATGKRPWQHGVQGHTEPRPSGWGARAVGSYSGSCKSLWNILGQSQLRCHVIGWPATHPAKPASGIVVSDRFSLHAAGVGEPIEVAHAVHPTEQLERFMPLRTSPAEVDPAALREFIPETATLDESVARHALATCAMILAETSTVHAVTTAAIELKPWDFAAVWYPGIERFSHGFMKYHPPCRAGVDQREFEAFQGVVTRAYEFHDMMLGRLLELAGSGTTVMLVSDHGFHHDHLRPAALDATVNSPETLAAWHRPQGIAVASGPRICAGGGDAVCACTPVDVAPTILALFGLPYGADMDGKVWSAAIDSSAEPDRVLSWESITDGADDNNATRPIDDTELASRAAAAHLAALGYREPPDTEMAAQAERAAFVNAMNLATSLIEARKPVRALDVLEPFRARLTTSADLQRLLAEALFCAGRDGDARRMMEDLLERGANAPLAHVGLGVMDLTAGQGEAALQHFAEAGQQNPDLPGLHTLVGRVYVLMQRWDDAEGSLLNATRLDPADADAFAALAAVRTAQGREEEGAELARRAIALRADLPRAHDQLGRALAATGHHAEARQAFESCLALDPDLLGAHRQLVNLYNGALFDPSRARRHAMRVQEITLWRRSRGRRDNVGE
jgi:predicted AlkP superfamily phosphohydrolase/phosphomutase/tetratricopeptide (TPR) repeat protein